jgi:hydrogenase expression/formation protein HypD
MKYVDEYRDREAVHKAARLLANAIRRPWRIMEVCGGQTHAFVRFGIDALLPSQLTLLHGPGCPVCVTPVELIDLAIALAADPKVILCSFGDMLRVPGSKADLFAAKSLGGDVRVVYSPLDALALAEKHRERTVVFFAVGFETTAPSTAAVVVQARRKGMINFVLLGAHVRVPPALEALLAEPDVTIDGFLGPGHVCAVMGLSEYVPLTHKYRVPLVATGFEPLDLLQGLTRCVEQLEAGQSQVEIQYTRAVRFEGNPAAQRLIAAVFEPVTRVWRGLGAIADGGLGLRSVFRDFDATARFALPKVSEPEPSECQSGLVLQGRCKPTDCAAFGTRCTPEHPLGATMVSSEGACAAYHRYRRAE